MTATKFDSPPKTRPMSNYGFSVPGGGYDDEDRLTGWNRTDGLKNQSWNLSLAGDRDQFTENLVTQTRTHTEVHELTAIGAVPLSYDPKGNLTTNSNGQTYTWDFDNRLHLATAGAKAGRYRYDALGRRVSKRVVNPGSTTTIFVYSNRQVLAEYNFVSALVPYELMKQQNLVADTQSAAASDPDATASAGTTTGSTSTVSPGTGYITTTVQLLRKYLYATYIDEPVLLIDRTSAGAQPAGTDEFFYYHRNNLYSIAALTNQAGAVQERYAYTAYGQTTFHDASGNLLNPQQSTVSNPYTYTGRRLDAETGLYYYRARYYDVDLGRFIGRDAASDPSGRKMIRIGGQLRFVPGLPPEDAHIGFQLYRDGMNAYVYGRQSPLVFVDPSGWESECTCGPKIDNVFVQMLRRLFIRMVHLPSNERGSIQGIRFLARNGMSIDFVVTNNTKCPTSGVCSGTNQLGGRCMHWTQVSNIVYGFVAAALQVDFKDAALGANLVDTERDEGEVQWASYTIGYDLLYWLANPDMACTEEAMQTILQKGGPFSDRMNVQKDMLDTAAQGTKYKQCASCGYEATAADVTTDFSTLKKWQLQSQ